MKVVNLFGDDSDRRRDRPGWQWNHLSVGLYELEPGQKTFPYHWQYVEEEMLIVVDRGPEGAHQLRNDTDGPVRLLMLSTRRRWRSPSTPIARRSASSQRACAC